MEPRPVLVLSCVMLALGLPRVALPAQSVRVLSDTPVSIGLTQPLVEPHLAIDPVSSAHLLGATIVGHHGADMRTVRGRAYRAPRRALMTR